MLEVPTVVDPRFHSYENAAFGDHEPGTAVSAAPTLAVPVMRGVGVVVNANETVVMSRRYSPMLP